MSTLQQRVRAGSVGSMASAGSDGSSDTRTPRQPDAQSQGTSSPAAWSPVVLEELAAVRQLRHVRAEAEVARCRERLTHRAWSNATPRRRSGSFGSRSRSGSRCRCLPPLPCQRRQAGCGQWRGPPARRRAGVQRAAAAAP
ncbi:MAG: hypothetical protein ACK4F6_19435, partial [Hylemonella sp.]